MKPIILITGATSGVGFGICERLLTQLCVPSPPDVEPQRFARPSDNKQSNGISIPCESLVLLLACRSIQRGERSRRKLLDSLDHTINKLKQTPTYDGQAERFRSNLVIEIVYCDLGVIKSVYECAKDINTRFPYVSHLVLNAGTSSVIGINFFQAAKDVLSNPVLALTSPTYKIEAVGETSSDGLGWVFQCNVFGHYVLYRALLPSLEKCPSSFSRVIWMSSHEALPEAFSIDDWQLTKTTLPYEGSKYEMDLLSATLDRSAELSTERKDPSVRHFTVHPGVVSTEIVEINWFLKILKMGLFYLVRLLLSPHHTIDPIKGAISATHLLLVSSHLLPSSLDPPTPSPPPKAALGTGLESHETSTAPIKFGSRTNWLGNEYVAVDPVYGWQENESVAKELLARLETLYTEFLQKASATD
ncbi:hypothetical protein SISNIDRAFT_480981 [Sistotremastrum niveocremeum HHB9708]|uniref:3beta-hydroxysteroid 3-dehydrogenase n=1 Tax=Sistotremastrum niveocremeum HHB9708 TaxID=1314777 RepID=A0A164ZXV9_9AGAM|nr:hypothetical protein SISNIDRAFT_480981 [Sistotremastrum niveocremeum HHB9708]